MALGQWRWRRIRPLVFNCSGVTRAVNAPNEPPVDPLVTVTSRTPVRTHSALRWPMREQGGGRIR